MHVVGMKVKKVEVAGALADFFELQHAIGLNVVGMRQSERLGGAGNQLRTGFGVSACEQGDLVSLPHQLLGQIGNDPFGSAIKLRRDALNQRRDLGDFHFRHPLRVNCHSNAGGFLKLPSIKEPVVVLVNRRPAHMV